jgi:hypothetical protein
MRSSLKSNDNALFHIFLDSDTMTKHTYLPNMGVMILMPPIIVETNNCRNKWKNSLQTHEKKEYAAYLQKLRKICPDNNWRLTNNRKYYSLFKNGVIQRHSNLDHCLKETCVQGNTN